MSSCNGHDGPFPFEACFVSYSHVVPKSGFPFQMLLEVALIKFNSRMGQR